MDLAEWHVEHVAVTEFKLKMILQNFNAHIATKMVPSNVASVSNLLIFTRSRLEFKTRVAPMWHHVPLLWHLKTYILTVIE